MRTEMIPKVRDKVLAVIALLRIAQKNLKQAQRVHDRLLKQLSILGGKL